MMKELDPLLHSQLRLAVMSILITVEEADFVYLKEQTQITKLQEAGYIEVEKGFQGKRPRTTCRVTPVGRSAFEEYVSTLRQYLNI